MNFRHFRNAIASFTRLLVVASAVLASTLSTTATSVTPSDAIEPVTDSTYATLVRDDTTDDRFLSSLVAELPDHPDIPSPREFL